VSISKGRYTQRWKHYRCGLTCALNNKQKVRLSRYANDLRVNPTNWFALFTLFWICIAQLRLRSIVELKLPTLRFRRLRGDIIEVYKILTGRYDKKVACDIFEVCRYYTLWYIIPNINNSICEVIFSNVNSTSLFIQLHRMPLSDLIATYFEDVKRQKHSLWRRRAEYIGNQPAFWISIGVLY
jgi:hypothetical protein